MRLWTPFLLSLMVCGSTLISAELLAWVLVNQLSWPHFSTSPRNNFHLRAWPEYSDPALRPPNVPLVVVITNSQGLYMEGEDGTIAWPHQLQEQLRATTGAPWLVANFSMARNKGVELTLMAARAAQLDPDVVMVVSGYENFTHRIDDLSDSPSDINQLVWDPEIRATLSGAFLDTFAPFDAGLWLEAHSSVFRVARRFFELRPHVWYWIWDDTQWKESWTPPPDWDTHASILVQEINRQIHREGSAELLMVDMPRCDDRWGDLGRNRMADFKRQVEQNLGSVPHTHFVDASHVIPCGQFYRRSLHFVPEAHQSFATFMLPYVLSVNPKE